MTKKSNGSNILQRLRASKQCRAQKNKMNKNKRLFTILLISYSRDGTGQDFLDPTQPVNSKIYAGWPGFLLVHGRPVFLQKVFVHCSMHLMKNFRKGRAKLKLIKMAMGEMLNFVTLNGGLRKKTQKIFCVFCKIPQF